MLRRRDPNRRQTVAAPLETSSPCGGARRRGARRAAAWSVLALLACALPLSCRRSEPADYLTASPDSWPTEGWRTASPEAVGVDSNALAALVRSVRAKRLAVHGLLVVRRGRVVLDASFFPYEGDEPHDLASVTKSVTATLVGVAVHERLVTGVRQPVLELLAPGRAAAGGKAGVTLEHLLTMTSGAGCGAARGGEMAETLAMQRSPDWVQFALDAPAARPPGTAFAYCNSDYHLLSGVISRVAGESALAFARRRLFEPLGIRDAAWPADPQGVNHGWGDLRLRPRELAKIGFLYLHGGSWDGRSILDPEWIARSARPRVRLPDGAGYGYGWWTAAGRFPGVYVARGRGGQLLAVSPARDLVVVLTGGGYRVEDVAQGLLAAIRPGTLPPDPAAEARLRNAVEAAAEPPPASPPAPLPEIARRISGRTWSFDENPLGIRSLWLAFDGDREGAGRIESAFGAISFRVGLDGVPRRCRGGRDGLRVAAVGAWRDGGLDLEVDEIAHVNRFRFRLAWTGGGDEVEAGVEEATGLVSPHRLHGREERR